MRHVLFVLISVPLTCGSLLEGGSLPFSRPGLMDIPTASVLHHTEAVLGGSFTAFGYERADSSSESDFAVAGHLEVGLFNRGQLGITWLGEAGISGNVKFLVLRESITTPGLAAGCQNITGEEDYEFFRDDRDSLYDYQESQNFSLYLVMTKSLDYFSGIPVCLHLGYGTGRFRQGEDEISDGRMSNPFRGLFAGMDYHPVPELSLILEWDGRDANFGAEYQLNGTVSFLGGLSEFEQMFASERDLTDVMHNPKFSLGVELAFGPFLNRTTLQPYEQLSEDYNRDLLEALEEIRSNAKYEIQELENKIR
ncbi:MAG: hypothetical protein AVO35_00090 [Candidatus Aegiribacteria sp. MLS_C]|nr:MAG: hypothetical protein AVO35_00090 [Candidatus Aegiribacteria sp. MLS_C]